MDGSPLILGLHSRYGDLFLGVQRRETDAREIAADIRGLPDCPHFTRAPVRQLPAKHVALSVLVSQDKQRCPVTSGQTGRLEQQAARPCRTNDHARGPVHDSLP